MTSRCPYRRHSTPCKRRDPEPSHNISNNFVQLWLTQFDRNEQTDDEAEASVIVEFSMKSEALPSSARWAS
jgi:transposase